MNQENDKFKPFEKLELPNFEFIANKFIVWQSGKTLMETLERVVIRGVRVHTTDISSPLKTAVFLAEGDTIYSYIKKTSTYDVFVSSIDRLMLLTLPKNPNIHFAQLEVLAQYYGYTTEYKSFTSDEPFACQLFYNSGQISMISIILPITGQLIEFYQLNTVHMEQLKYFKQILNDYHDPIIDFFKKYGFGTINPVLTYLSILSPEDRCAILEELYDPKKQNHILNDKLLLAYVTNGRRDLAEKVILNAISSGVNSDDIYFLRDKLESGLAPKRTSQERIEIYNSFKSGNDDPIELEFLNIVINFCKQVY